MRLHLQGSGRAVWMNTQSGLACAAPPQSSLERLTPLLGGMLCDEMVGAALPLSPLSKVCKRGACAV